jgi:NADPH:quinone reductase-like Zn-dependent oxidoreductase
MKAVVYTRYGPPDMLRLTDVPSPVPKDGEVLVQVHAVSLNAIATGHRPPLSAG